MLTNDTYMMGLYKEMEFNGFHKTAEQLRNAKKHSKAVNFILHETGKALVSTGNRLLKIA